MVDFSHNLLADDTFEVKEVVVDKPHDPDTTSGCTYGVALPDGQLQQIADQSTTVQSLNPTSYELPTLEDCQGNNLVYDLSNVPSYISSSGSTMTFAPQDNAIAGKHVISFAAQTADPVSSVPLSLILTIYPSRCFPTCETC